MAFSINRVRNVTSYLLKKNNYGQIEPSQFDSLCDLAQNSIFESLFYSDNFDTIKKGNRLTNDQYADLKKIREEQIDVYSIYSTPSNFTYDSGSGLWKYIGTDLYRAIDLSLVHTSTKKKVSIEMNLKTKLNYAVNSNINPPTINFPEYCRVGEGFHVFPDAPTGYHVELLYLRKPKTPKWTYEIVGGNAVFNASATDKQDIDLHESLYERFVVKVLSYMGLSLKDTDVTQATENESALINQTQS